MRPCQTDKCVMSREFCLKRCKYNGGSEIPHTKTGFPTAMLREYIAEMRGDFRPGVVRASG